MLVHSTASENLYSILYQGLDLVVGNYWKLGGGVRFAEDVSIFSGFHIVTESMTTLSVLFCTHSRSKLHTFVLTYLLRPGSEDRSLCEGGQEV
jgi:hypothetical protein